MCTARTARNAGNAAVEGHAVRTAVNGHVASRAESELSKGAHTWLALRPALSQRPKTDARQATDKARAERIPHLIKCSSSFKVGFSAFCFSCIYADVHMNLVIPIAQ